MTSKWERTPARVHRVDFHTLRTSPAADERIERDARAQAYISARIQARQSRRSRVLLTLAALCAAAASGVLVWMLIV